MPTPPHPNPTTHSKQVQQFIARFIAANPLNDPDLASRTIIADSFGDSPQLADELLNLVLAGTKTASCSCLWQWEAQNETPLTQGTLAVICDSSNTPRCILQTLEVVHKPFNQVDAQFAYDEGEGDRTCQYWRKAHWAFFSRTLPAINRKPAQNMPMLCERFRVIYQEN